MIISIDFFIFEAKNIINYSEKLTPHFGKFEPIVSNPHYHNTKGSTSSKVIQGVYIADSNSKPEIIKQIAKNKKVVRFTLANGTSSKAIITNFTQDKKHFLPYSGAVKIDFQIEIIEIDEDFNIFGDIYELL